MGLPEQDLNMFLDWVHDMLHLSYEQDPDRGRQLAAINAVSAYFAEQIAMRRETPRGDLLSHAMTWTVDGAPVSDADLHAFCVLMFQAGLDTVPISVGWALYHFATHPGQRADIVADPSLIPTAVEEVLRVYSFVVPGRARSAACRSPTPWCTVAVQAFVGFRDELSAPRPPSGTVTCPPG